MISLISRGSFVRDDQGRPTKAVGVCFLNKSSNDILKNIVAPTPPVPPIATRASSRSLTKQQREVLRHAVEGKSVKETALALNISETTVRQHQRDARNRLGARTVMHAASLALRAQLI